MSFASISAPVAGSIGTWPETKTRFPARIPWEYGPIAAGSSDVVTTRFPALFSMGSLLGLIYGSCGTDHFVDSIDTANGCEDALEMLHIRDLDDQIDGAALIGGTRLDMNNIGTDFRDNCGNLREHAGSILGDDRQGNGIGFGQRRRSRPLDLDLPCRIVEQVLNVGTVLGMNRHAFSARDVSDDFFTAN